MKTSRITKKIYAFIRIIVTACVAMVLSGCPDDDNGTIKTTTIYTAGYTQQVGPCYWEGNERTELLVLGEVNTGGRARDIYVTQGNIYVAGYAENTAGVDVPCYWFNGTYTGLPVIDPNNNGEANGIYAVGNAVFTIGYTKDGDQTNIPCYWINQEKVDLEILDETRGGEAFGMQVIDNILYTAGYSRVPYDNNGDGMIAPDEGVDLPCYWIGDTIVILPVPEPDKGGQAQAIYVVENDVYVGGYIINEFDVEVPCYWQNGTYNDLPVPDTDEDARVEAIQVVGNKIYTAGYNIDEATNDENPCYWEDKTHISLPFLDPGQEEGAVYDIQVVEKTIYTAGYARNAGPRKPCSWINLDNPMELFTSGVPELGRAYAIQVVEE